jgi:VanZ family protein
MQIIRRWGPVIVWMAVIFALSAQSTLPRGPDPILEVIMRKLAHFSEYALLAALALRALGSPWTRARGVQALAIAVGYAISDEFHQSFVPLRTPAPTDVVIDAAGALCSLVICTLWLTRRRVTETLPISHPPRR